MKRKALLLASSVAVAGLLFAACGGDDDDAADTTAAAETTAAASDNASGDMGDEATMDIVDTAVEAGDFTTLASLLEAAGLVDTLKGDGPFTVFAPTDEAFAAVPADTLEALGANQEALQQVLTYHVVAGEVKAADVQPGDVEMLSGDTATITVDGGTVMINDATVTATDVMASNGVIHVIDAVILPPDLEL